MQHKISNSIANSDEKHWFLKYGEWLSMPSMCGWESLPVSTFDLKNSNDPRHIVNKQMKKVKLKALIS